MRSRQLTKPNSGYRRRDLMHITHIAPFTEWLMAQGWKAQSPLVWEVIRMRKDHETCIVWLKSAAKEHCTIQGVSRNLLNEWRRTWQDDKHHKQEQGRPPTTRAEYRGAGPK